jgi:HNH endonuclease
MREDQLREVFQKTGGYCHYCGDRLRFENRGWSAFPRGHWEADHVVQRGKGGYDGIANYLPACTECNRLRWARTGPALRRLLRLGLIATEEIDRASPVGLHLKAMLKKRLLENEARRLEKYLDGDRWELYRDQHFRGRARTLERRLRGLAAERGGSIRIRNENNEKLVVQFIAA